MKQVQKRESSLKRTLCCNNGNYCSESVFGVSDGKWLLNNYSTSARSI